MMAASSAARRFGGPLRFLPLGTTTVLAVGLLLTTALSLPAVLEPSTRSGATLAGALIAGALAAKGKTWPARAARGALLGLLLGAALSIAGWGLLSNAPDAALWQVTGLNVAANSTIRPVDEAVTSWFSGYGLLEGHLLYIRFAVSNLLLGLVGGLAGGLLASGRLREAGLGLITPEIQENGEVAMSREEPQEPTLNCEVGDSNGTSRGENDERGQQENEEGAMSGEETPEPATEDRTAETSGTASG